MMPEVWFSPRLTLGLGNPNTAGALLAMLLVSVLAFCLGSRWRWIPALAASAGLGCGITLTSSRGGLVALAVGLTVLAIRGTRADRVLLAVCGLMVLGIFVGSPAVRRIHAPNEDASLAARWTVLSHVPAMMVAAPGGWGAGRSAEAYEEWFQPAGPLTHFTSVLSTHAVWLVERGWPVRILYVAMWILCIQWCATAGPRWSMGGAACWAAFAVAACFSHVGERPIMWILPAIWILAAAVARLCLGRYPSLSSFRLGLMTALVIILGLVLLGAPWKPGPRLHDGVVRIDGGGEPTRIISVAGEGVPASGLGREIRNRVPRNTRVEYAWDRTGMLRGETLFIVGGAVPRMAPGVTPRREVWLLPEGILPPQLPAALRSAPVTVLTGQFASFTVAPWTKYFSDGGAGHVTVLPGVGNFVEDAWGVLLSASP